MKTRKPNNIEVIKDALIGYMAGVLFFSAFIVVGMIAVAVVRFVV